MAHGYRILSHWNDWLGHHFLGRAVLQAETAILDQLLHRHFGKHALLIGVPSQFTMLQSTTVPFQTLLTPILYRETIPNLVEGDLHELPLLTGSLDLVMLPHTLELVDNPRQLLAEACRIIKPEGLIIISGFNPYSLWGIHKLLTKNKTLPRGINFIHSRQINNWLRLADFEIENYRSTLYRPPLKPNLFQKFEFLERVGKTVCPYFGGVYTMLARAKVLPLTPIRLQWKQQINGIRISSTMSGHIARSK